MSDVQTTATRLSIFEGLTLKSLVKENRVSNDGTVYEGRCSLLMSDDSSVKLIDTYDKVVTALKSEGTAEGLLAKVVKKKGDYGDYYALSNNEVVMTTSIADLLA